MGLARPDLSSCKFAAGCVLKSAERRVIEEAAPRISDVQSMANRRMVARTL